MSERIDLYDLNHRATGRTRDRAIPHDPDHTVLITSFWVRDAAGRLLLSQRSADRRWFPLWWENGGGCARAAETAYEAALREAREELGLNIPEQDWRYLGEFDHEEVLEGQFFHHWNQCFLAQLRTEQPEVRGQDGEVVQVRWFTPDELETLMETGELLVTDYTKKRYALCRKKLRQPMTVPGQKQCKMHNA